MCNYQVPYPLIFRGHVIRELGPSFPQKERERERELGPSVHHDLENTDFNGSLPRKLVGRPMPQPSEGPAS
jgi:hypothetical protein